MSEKIKFYDQTQLPEPSEDDKDFSDDVFIVDEDGMYGLAYYSFADSEWAFHTDTLVDYNEDGANTDWRWCYPPFTAKDAGL
jgi:hypothetical protein